VFHKPALCQSSTGVANLRRMKPASFAAVCQLANSLTPHSGANLLHLLEESPLSFHMNCSTCSKIGILFSS
jgi:hypothetical protein